MKTLAMNATMMAIEIANVRRASSSGGNALATRADSYFLSVITCAMTSFMA